MQNQQVVKIPQEGQLILKDLRMEKLEIPKELFASLGKITNLIDQKLQRTIKNREAYQNIFAALFDQKCEQNKEKKSYKKTHICEQCNIIFQSAYGYAGHCKKHKQTVKKQRCEQKSYKLKKTIQSIQKVQKQESKTQKTD